MYKNDIWKNFECNKEKLIFSSAFFFFLGEGVRITLEFIVD